MHRRFLAILACAFSLGTSWADSTINSTNAYSWGANIGWMNWRPSATDGVVIGEYICSGWIWGANVGWINMGDGTPDNNIQYSNTSGTDFGVNYQIDPMLPGKAILRGFAYGANIGWINFESTGNPRLRFSDGRLEGYAWSANCGWINLGDGTFAVQTDYVANGVDTDMDGMADAFEWQYFMGLSMNASTDTDGDGMTDVQEYLEGTDPTQATSRLRIITITNANMGANSTTQLLWASTVGRLYAIDTTTDITNPASWADVGLDSGPNSIIPSVGPSTSRPVTLPTVSDRFFRVRAVRPLPPPTP
jgi:hypothetical protein